ncbi:MAG: FGGY-family carbohydrate kinase [Promethearchaeota archaeon]
MESLYLMIDFGSSMIKVTVGDVKGKIRGFAKIAPVYFTPEELDPYGVEFNPDQMWNNIVLTARKAIAGAQIDSSNIEAISFTSQRHGVVFLDANEKEIYAGPTRDARGLEVDIDDYIDPEDLYNITGHGPPFLFALARYLWFQENEEEKHTKIRHYLTTDGWIAHRLTGKHVIDDTGAAESLWFDIHRRTWSNKILDSCEIPHEILPERVSFAENLGSILPEAAEQLGVSMRTVAVISAADTQASLIGCGAFHVGDVGIVAGSTMPIQMVIDQSVIDPKQRIWTGAFSIPWHWVIESNAEQAGEIHSWFIDTFLKRSNDKRSYDEFEELVLSQPPGAGGVYADLGARIMDAQNMVQLPQTKFIFPPPSYGIENVSLSSFARATIENLAYAARANIEQILEVVNRPVRNYFLVGGLSRSAAFTQILADVLKAPIYATIPEGTALAGFAAARYAKEDMTYEEAIAQFITPRKIVSPNEKASKEYESCFLRWKEIYAGSRDN